STRQRPADATLQAELAWAEIEQRQWDSAIQRFTNSSVSTTPDLAATARAGRAVAHWQAGRADKALEDFNAAVKEMPEWSNPAWVKALYSPLVADTLRSIAAERARRDTRK